MSQSYMFRALLPPIFFALLLVLPKLSNADRCDDIDTLVGYGVIGEGSFDYGNNSEINGNNISGNGNTPTPSGTTESVNLDFPDNDPSIFPVTGGADLKPPSPPAVSAGSYGTIEFERKNNSPTLSFTGGDYFIEELILKKGATVQFAPGNYFIETIDFDNKSEIVISPPGQVNIYIKDSFQAGNQTEINSAGNTGNLVFYLYDSASFQLGNADNGGANVDFNGIIYSPYSNTSIDFGNNNDIKGAIFSAGSVDVGNNTSFDYSAAVQDEVIDALGCTPTAAGPDHYQISHSSNGVTCEAEAVVVTAHDAGDLPVVPSSSTTISLSTSIANDGWSLKSGNGSFIAPNQYTFDGVESTVEFWLRKTTATLAPHMDLDVSDGTASDPDNGGAEDLPLEFSDTALRFYADGVHNSIGTQLAGKSSAVIPGDQTLTLRAVQTNTDTGACQARVNGIQSVQISYDCVNPTNCKNTIGVSITDTTLAVPTSISDTAPGSNVNLNFDVNGIATWTLNYIDAGQISLSAILDIAAVGNDPADTLVGTSNTFLSKPAGLCVTATDADSTCVSGDASCTKFKKAREPFNLRVQAVGWQNATESNADFCVGNTITPNFELANIGLSHTLVAPAGNAGNLGVSSLDMLLSDDGEHTVSNQSISEVGVFTFTATPPAPPVTSIYFGETIAASTSANVGRFYPDHFVLSGSLLTNRSDQTCGPLSTFTYMDENFQVSYDLTAMSAGGAGANVTENYVAGFAKLDAQIELQTVAVNITGPTNLTARLTTSPAFTVNNGVVSVTDTMTFSRPLFPSPPDGPFNVSVGIDPVDDDGVQLIYDTVNEVDLAGNVHELIDTTRVLFGRLVIANAFGSELQPLNIAIRAQNYDGVTTNTFVGNSNDLCTQYNVANIDLSAAIYPGPLTAAHLGLTGVGVLVLGASQFVMHDNASSSVGPGVTGEVLYDMTVPSYLQYDWIGSDGFTDNPSAKASFGIFNGDSRKIYFRQIYR